MRPTRIPQSVLRFPLTHILGTEANVRVLRVLALSEIPIGVSEIARLAELQASGVARVCEQLEDFGVIESVGRGGHGRQFRRAGRYTLWHQLGALFTAERLRAEAIISAIQSVVRGAAPLPRAAWIEGPVAVGRDQLGDPVIVGVLTTAEKVAGAREDIWGRLLPIQKTHDVVLELRVYSAADLETLSADRHSKLEQVQLLLGPPPLDVISSAGAPGKRSAGRLVRTHEQLDDRSLKFAATIADELRRNPALAEDAARWIERRVLSASPGERLELEEWLGILITMSVARLRRLLVEDSARMTRLRQSLPFVHVLPKSKRRAAGAARRQ